MAARSIELWSTYTSIQELLLHVRWKDGKDIAGNVLCDLLNATKDGSEDCTEQPK